MIEYKKRLTEVEVILNHLSKQDFNKIPKELINAIVENKDNEYVWNYDENKTLKEQILSKDTIAIISYINMKYLLNEKQKDFIKKIHDENERKCQEELKRKYNSDDIFRNKANKNITQKNLELVTYKEPKWYQKIFNRILRLIRK